LTDLRSRSGLCPGCGNRFCDAHQIKHWADSGETRLDNLVLLCRRHHRAVYEEGFNVEIMGDEGGSARARFRWPDGRPFPDVPPVPRLSDDPLTALEAKHSTLEIRVDRGTTTPHWKGERFDVGWAIYTMRDTVRNQ
jgi:hypothetical protein